MSRDIPGSLHAKEEKELLHGNDGKLLFTGYEGNMGAFLFAGGRLRGAMNLDSLTGIRPGNIYLARVRKKVPNIDACFAELPGGELCYLAMKDCSQALPVNRNPDSRSAGGRSFPRANSKGALKDQAGRSYHQADCGYRLAKASFRLLPTDPSLRFFMKSSLPWQQP